jgi:porin
VRLHTLPCSLVACLVPALRAQATPPQEPAPADPTAQAPADDGASTRQEWIGRAPFIHWTRAAGNCSDWRTHFEDSGIEIGGGYTLDWGAPLSGGSRRRDAMSSLLDVNVAFDLETLLGLRRTIAYVDAYAIFGTNLSRDVGDAQGLSNIQGTDVEQIAEVWLETWLGDEFRLKVGKVDFNSEFAFQEIGGDFVNSTAAITPTIVSYPTYPNPATSINLFWQPEETWYVGGAVYDGAAADGIATGKRGPKTFFRDNESDAWFLATEGGYAWAGGESWGSGRVALGTWYHTARFTTFDGDTDRGTAGLYATFEQQVWRENPTDAEDTQGFGVFVMVGTADQDVSAIANTVAAGAIWNGVVPGRDRDGIGLAILHADLSDDGAAGTPLDETAWELLYRCQLTPAISLKPDLQFIQNAGGADGADDVFVAMLRFEVLF